MMGLRKDYGCLLVICPMMTMAVARCEVNPWSAADVAGELCEMQDDCASQPCMNSGECTSLDGGGFSCQCAAGFEGLTCEVDINECEMNSNLCLNGATCVNTDGSYRFES